MASHSDKSDNHAEVPELQEATLDDTDSDSGTSNDVQPVTEEDVLATAPEAENIQLAPAEVPEEIPQNVETNTPDTGVDEVLG